MNSCRELEIRYQLQAAVIGPIRNVAGRKAWLENLTAIIAFAAVVRDLAGKAEDPNACPNCGGGCEGGECRPDDDTDYCADTEFSYVERPRGYPSWTAYVVDRCHGSTDGIENPHGHHIVMNGDAFPENAEARQILCKYDIDPYTGCANLTISPNRCHSGAYARHVLNELQRADETDDEDEIIRTLGRLAEWHRGCGAGPGVSEETDE
ncbi:hypothetical protein GC176_06110 [bacterium]|nr:hypothetical protein [bacterium]